MNIALSGSVGNNGDNLPDDVKKVQQRLKDLGFKFIGAIDGDVGNKTIKAIKLFQSIKNGSQKLGGDGLVEVNGDTHKWLNASNAPHWKNLTASGSGFVNIEVADASDNHDFGTDWLDETIIRAAAQYKTAHLDSHTASLLTVNDASMPEGGNTPEHAGHETGLSCDLRLPQKAATGAAPGGRTWQSSDYDRVATRAILVALRTQPLADASSLFFNDPELIAEGLCKKLDGHDNHIHFQIKPPVRQS